MGPVSGQSTDPDIPAVEGTSVVGTGVHGFTSASGGLGVYGECATGHGVHGKSASGRGVVGVSDSFQGVYGHSDQNAGVVGESENMHAVFGVTKGAGSSGVYGTNNAPGDTGAGVLGENPGGDGVVGKGRRGVVGMSVEFQGVYGHSDQNAGVVGESNDFDGVYGVSHNLAAAGVSGHNPGGRAGFFEGNVVVTGDIQLAGADLAEQFDLSGSPDVEPGTVVVIEGVDQVRTSNRAYDRRVAGVISGAGAFRPGIMLDHRDGLPNRLPLALVGKVLCKVDASYGPIQVGDLLTTSPTPGHAMKVTDHEQAFGAVLGKAMASLIDGRDLLPILVTLQ